MPSCISVQTINQTGQKDDEVSFQCLYAYPYRLSMVKGLGSGGWGGGGGGEKRGAVLTYSTQPVSVTHLEL